MPGPSEEEEGTGPSPSRVWAGRVRDLQEGASGLATSQLCFPKRLQPCCTMQMPLFRGGGRRNHRSPVREISPQSQGEGDKHPAASPPVSAGVRGHPCLDLGNAQEPGGCARNKSPLPGAGIGTHSVATPALSLWESDVPRAVRAWQGVSVFGGQGRAAPEDPRRAG